MPPPFLSYLRVYEPMEAFEGAAALAVNEGLDRGPVDAAGVPALERELCLRATVRGRLLPEPRNDVLFATARNGTPVFCPLEIRPRAGAALLAFLDSATPTLASAAVPASTRAARGLAEAAVAELGGRPAHVVSASWMVPMPWFGFVRDDIRQFQLNPRRVWFQQGMRLARERVALIEGVLRDFLDDEGPADMLAEIVEWLSGFHRDSVVEMDYGGVVELMDADAIRDDPSASGMAVALGSLAAGESEKAAERYQKVREFWAPVRAQQYAS